ncbi:hypothetical protein DPMN_161904 [Dreissena polymorpha]|uniref:Uncharacterized protein n=1 Tax=Dreissena polymorpha TaxID=45954 RepID=A0A9D4ENI7_DREPO|nr:hypothetical protein DPMN_161904 [Dreissena polymorpha]
MPDLYTLLMYISEFHHLGGRLGSTTSEGGVQIETQSHTRLSEDKDCYFQDGKRKIGRYAEGNSSEYFMLVYEEDIVELKSLETQKGSTDHKRYKFLESLRKAGLEMEEVGTAWT